MASIQDRWWKTVRLADKTQKRVKTARYGKGDRYRVRYTTPDGRGQSKSFPDRQKKAAEDFLINIEADKRRGEFVNPKAGKTPFEEIAESWMRTRQLDPSTREVTERRVRNHLIAHFRGRGIADIKPSEIRSWDTGLSRTLAPGTRLLCFTNLSSIFTAAVDDGMIGKNPCSAKSVTAPRPIRRKVVPWKAEVVSAIRSGLPERYRPMVDVGGGCGTRQGEIFGVSPDDFDFANGWLNVERQIKLVRGRLVFGLPKNDKSRTTLLPAPVGQCIQAHMERFPPQLVTLPWEDPFSEHRVTVSLVFTTSRRNALNRSNFQTQYWKPALRDAGLECGRDNGMHALRHLFASVLLDAGENIRAIAEWLGHEDPAFTLRTYTHLMHSNQARALGALNDLVNALHGPPMAPRSS